MRKLALIIVAVLAVALTGCAPEEQPAPVQSAETPAAGSGGKKPAAAPVKLQATRTKFAPGPLNSGGQFTSVKVTVTNQAKSNLDVNPLYFSITDSTGQKHDVSSGLGEDVHQIGTLRLAPGEKATGTVTAEGRFSPKTVTFTKDGFGTSYRAEVG